MASKSFQVDFKTASVKQLAADLKAAAAAGQQLAAVFQQANAGVTALAKAGGAVVGVGGGGAPGGGGGARGTGLPSGPFQRLRQAQASFQKALQQGTTDQVNDAALALKRAEQNVVRANRQMNSTPLGKAAANLVGSTRLGFGKGGMSIMPLVSSIGKLAGAAAEQAGVGGAGLAEAVAPFLGPLLVAAAGVAAEFIIAKTVMETFVDATLKAAEVLSSFGVAGAATGATGAQLGGLRALGFGGADIAGLSAGLAGNTGMFAELARANLGVGVTMPRPFSQNEGGDMAAVFKALQAQFNVNPDEARRNAQMLGLPEGITNKFDVSPAVQAARGRDETLFGKLDTKTATTNANSLTAAFDRISQSLENAQIALSPAMPFLTTGLLAIGDAINRVAEFVSNNPRLPIMLGKIAEGLALFAAAAIDQIPQLLTDFDKVYKVWADFEEQLYEVARGLLVLFNPALGKQAPLTLNLPKSILGPDDDAQAKAQAALDKIAQHTGDMAGFFNAGTFGGGANARGAIPGELKGLMLGGAIAGNALRLGAFTI